MYWNVFSLLLPLTSQSLISPPMLLFPKDTSLITLGFQNSSSFTSPSKVPQFLLDPPPPPVSFLLLCFSLSLPATFLVFFHDPAFRRKMTWLSTCTFSHQTSILCSVTSVSVILLKLFARWLAHFKSSATLSSSSADFFAWAIQISRFTTLFYNQTFFDVSSFSGH